MWVIKQKNWEFSQYYSEFQVIATCLDFNPSALRNAHKMGLCEEIKNSFTYGELSEELPAFVTVCQTRDVQIRHRHADKVAQNTAEVIGFTSPGPAPSPKVPEMAPVGTVAGYTQPPPMEFSAGKWRISEEEGAKRFADGRCLYCSGLNHRAAECAARKKSETFKVAGAEVKEVGTMEGSEESGKDKVNLSRMELWLTRKSLVLNVLRCFGISRLSVSKVEVLAGSMEGKHLVIICTLTVNNQVIPTHALIDCGATGMAFVYKDFACHHQKHLQELKKRKQVEVINGWSIESGDITHIAKVGMEIQDHGEQQPMFITKSEQYAIALEILWLRLQDVEVRFTSNTVTIGSIYCTTYCQDLPVMVEAVTEEPLELVYLAKDIFETQILSLRPFQGNLVMLNGAAFFCTVKEGELTVVEASLYDINKAIEAKDLKEWPLEERVPEQYYKFLPLFSSVLADRLPLQRPGIDHDVHLKDVETSWGPLCSMWRAELVVLKE